METLPDSYWSILRQRSGRIAAALFIVMAAVQAGIAGGVPLWQGSRILAAGYAALCGVAALILIRRSTSEAMTWKITAWIVCAGTGLAIPAHLIAAAQTEQMVMGALSSAAGAMALFTAFLPDAADMLANPRLSQPESDYAKASPRQ